MRVAVAEPSPMLREVLAGAFRDAPDIDVVGSADSLRAALDTCLSAKPRVLLTGTEFPDGEIIGRINEILVHDVRVLVVCDIAAGDVATILLFAGASGFLYWQDCSPGELVDATRAVAKGHAALHPAAAGAVLDSWRNSRTQSPVPAPPSLTARERDVLEALALGLTTKAIGRRLTVSPKTVEAHIGKVLTKLNARNRAQAVSSARRLGLLNRQDQR